MLILSMLSAGPAMRQIQAIFKGVLLRRKKDSVSFIEMHHSHGPDSSRYTIETQR